MRSERRLSQFPERIRRPPRLSRIPRFFERSGRDRRPPIDARSDAKPLPCHHWNDRSLQLGGARSHTKPVCVGDSPWYQGDFQGDRLFESDIFASDPKDRQE